MGSRLEKNSAEVRKRIEGHNFEDEEGEEYNGSKFGGFTDYFRRKKIKLQNLDAELRLHSAENPPIFRGVVAHVNGYTQPSLNDLHTLIVTHGGGFLQYLDGKTMVTHIIAGSLTPKKKVEFARYRIVQPAWIVDSVKAGSMLPWDAYRVVDEGVKQKVLGFDSGHMVSQANTQRQGYRDQSNTSWYASQLRDVAQEIDGTNHINNRVGQDAPVDDEAQPLRLGREFEAEDGNMSDLKQEDADLLLHPSLQSSRPSADDHLGFDQHSISAHSIISAPNEAAISHEDSSKPDVEGTANIATSMPMDTEQPQSAESQQLTAEEHNAILLQNPHLAKSSTANPDFLNQYYRESRLHHLSTWKAELKAQLQARAAEKSPSQKDRHKRTPGGRRYIMHVDFDSFFAAVSLQKHPQLATKPVAIAHGSGPSSEIASCNYPARKFGIKNGMWMKTALQLCSEIKVLPYDFKAYEEASRHFYDSILAVDGIVQSISIDEALVDISQQCIEAGGSDGKDISEGSIYREQSKAQELAQLLRTLVKEKTGCDVSVGIGNNILLAKVALRKAKPAGQHIIKPEDALDFVGELTVTDLPGVAYSIGNKLEEIGIKYVKDIRSLTKERLINALGPKTGEKIWDYSRGIDRVEIGEQVIRKSVSAEVNWGIRFVTQQQAEEFVQCLCDELQKRLLEQAVKGKQLTMKIMRKAADAGMDPPKSLGHGKCDTFNKSVVLGVATNDKEVLGKEAISILRGYGFSPGELRGLGVQMQKLEPLKPLPSAKADAYDSSQRRLQFKKPSSVTPSTLPSFEATSGTSIVRHSKLSSQLNKTADPIEEVLIPEKASSSTTIKGALGNAENLRNSDVKQRPLNTAGTQFLLPSQIDPTVLDKLPSDIRLKLAPKQNQTIDSMIRPKSTLNTAEMESRSASPYPSDSDCALPNQSQIDPEILEALPDDVRQELLAHYKATGARAAVVKNHQVLPQSPRKSKTIAPSKKLVLTPTKKQKTSTIFGRGKPKTNLNSGSTLTQSNFVSLAKAQATTLSSETVNIDDISQSFLDELPEDIRLEIIAEQKRNRLKSKAGLSIGTTKRKHRTNAASDIEGGQRIFHLPPPPEKPTFTSRKLSTLPELREAMSAWVEGFSQEDEEGPFDEDVDALTTYLGKVVGIEHDLSKAVAIADWVAYLVDDREMPNEQVRGAWTRTILSIQEGIQRAVKERGLPPVAFVGR